ncbi:cohesin domain-containing protein [Jeongeupia sp. USM3]|uniref:cohesin domain-containing protein n=1 Tax=Jeongeupia sp. USM3 TaxID=1906741 RepID=UPI00089DFDAC|nr:cohesin domain-containing protein [Jeongeupia sp. USM3]AOX99681.1 hypothetical protein BJP62_03950 [Jeongeupia sp. USM3]
MALLMVALLCSCAAGQAFREGNTLLEEGKTEQGLAKLAEAAKLEPKNMEYRIALSSRRDSIINKLIDSGERARREGRLTEAEKAYRQVQAIDPNNAMARQGLDALVIERRHRAVVAEAEALFKKGGQNDLADAAEKLRPVLSENPNQKEALNLKARIDEARGSAVKPEAKLAAAYRKPVSLEFRDAPLRSVLESIAKVSGLTFFYDKDVRPDLKATVVAKNTSIEDTIRLLLVTNQLEQKVLSDSAILIYPNTPQKLKDYQTLAVRSFYLTNADVKAVANTLKTIVKMKDMVVDERLGIIIVRDTPESIRMAERLVALQDLSDPEVMLDVEVMEIKRSRLLELGIQWPGQLSLSPLQFGGAPLSLYDLTHLNSSRIQASIGPTTINARKEDQDGNILANPRIRVRNKEKAKILIGDRVPVITTTSTSTGFVSDSVSYVDVGLKLDVEPNIYLDEEVAIKVNLEVSNLIREVTSKSGTLAYQIGTRGASTVLRLKDGETQVLAGLISDEDRTSANKVPGLGEMPVLGRLFGSQKDDTQRTEILLSITPRVVRSLRRPDLQAIEFESGTETSIGAGSLRLGTVEPEKREDEGAKASTTSAPAAPKTPATTDAGKGTTPVVTPLPAATPSTPVAGTTTPASTATPALNWQAPAQAKVGEQFSVVLKVNSQGALSGMPTLIGFDPALLQVVSVQEGEFFKQNGGQTNFSHRIDAAQGKVFVATVRQTPSGNDAGVNGTGALAMVTFKALKPTATAKVQLLSASPEPAPAAPIALPIEQIIRIVQ